MITHPIRSFIALVVVTTLAGCSSVGGSVSTGQSAPTPAASWPRLAGGWMGALQIEGQGFNAMLDVAQTDGDLAMEVEIPMLELVTIGRGTVLPDGTLRVSFRYELECPGHAEFVGEVSGEESVMEGTLLASDCTGDLRGTFRFGR